MKRYLRCIKWEDTCGWKGEYMKGKMIVYLPNENEGLHTDILYEFHEIYCETIIER